MKIILNADIKPNTIDAYLEKAKQKADKIDAFCKANKIDELYYRDSEMEYEYTKKGGAKNGKD